MFSNPLPRVLFVSYLFPPTGGVGVQRVSKFVKYLPRHGWNSSVLTVSNASVPLQDESLIRDIPPGTIIRRAKTYEPSYALKSSVSGGSNHKAKSHFLIRTAKKIARDTANTILQPDSQVLWHPHAYRAGLRLLNEVPHDVIIATGPPFSSFLLGAKLSRKTGLPLILDYRDEWDISNAYWENKNQGRFANLIQARQHASVVHQADYLLATSPSSAGAIEQFARDNGSGAAVGYIYNGFDPDDYPVEVPGASGRLASTANKFRLAFIGTLWNLNSIEPVVEALLRICDSHPILASSLELFLAGRRTPDQEAILDRLNGTVVTVTKKPFVSHDEAISLMRSADALLMLNSDLPKAQRIINAKTFEYMAARRPIFVVAPQGDVWDLVQNLPGTTLCRPGDVSGIADRLLMSLELYRCGERFSDAVWDISQFERNESAKQLAETLDQFIGLDDAGVLGTSGLSELTERSGNNP
ncbi:hypothetical protein [Planctomicrobium sp. SH527]|uniref:hypothetical protein n=1 Tax=Planctomicrobium sp. SH527 TaxID=3448123 RepID=UPI003F5B2BF8